MPRDLNPLFDEFFEVGNVPATGCRLDIEVGRGAACCCGSVVVYSCTSGSAVLRRRCCVMRLHFRIGFAARAHFCVGFAVRARMHGLALRAD